LDATGKVDLFCQPNPLALNIFGGAIGLRKRGELMRAWFDDWWAGLRNAILVSETIFLLTLFTAAA
jgi:hypothetical protein